MGGVREQGGVLFVSCHQVTTTCKMVQTVVNRLGVQKPQIQVAFFDIYGGKRKKKDQKADITVTRLIQPNYKVTFKKELNRPTVFIHFEKEA